MTDENSVPTLTQKDQDQLDNIVSAVQEEFGMHVSPQHTNYDTGRVTFQLQSHFMDEESNWARVVHDLKEQGYSPEEVRAAVHDIEELEDQGVLSSD